MRQGLWDGLNPAELAACVSALSFESRQPDDAHPPRLPKGRVPEALSAMVRTWGELDQLEKDNDLSFLRAPDLGFAWAAYRWARGASLESVLEGSPDLTPGDFVRCVKQLIDLLDQIAKAASRAPTAQPSPCRLPPLRPRPLRPLCPSDPAASGPPTSPNRRDRRTQPRRPNTPASRLPPLAAQPIHDGSCRDRRDAPRRGRLLHRRRLTASTTPYRSRPSIVAACLFPPGLPPLPPPPACSGLTGTIVCSCNTLVWGLWATNPVYRCLWATSPIRVDPSM